MEAIANQTPHRHKALVYFLAYSGVRMGEATALRVKNLDLIQKRVRIVESSPEVGGRKMPPGRTKTNRTRAVAISDDLAQELADHLAAYGSRDGGAVNFDAFVFTGERGAQIRQGNWRERIFQPACRRAGVTRKGRDRGVEVPRVHDLRHTAASLASLQGYSMHEVKDMLGHSTIKTTSDRYSHLFEDAKTEKANLLGRLAGIAGPRHARRK